MNQVQKDNGVYHGLAGHFFQMGIPHLLEVRIIADVEDRGREEMKQENISAEMARYVVKKGDDESPKRDHRQTGTNRHENSEGQEGFRDRDSLYLAGLNRTARR
jgi:hypothetical protein